jgi:TonB family protein
MRTSLARVVAFLCAANGSVAVAQDNSAASAGGPPVAAPPALRQAMTEDAKVVIGSALGECFRRAPVYPSLALRLQQQGETVVVFEVSESGVAQKPAVHRSSRYRTLDEAALSHMRRCLEETADQVSGKLPAGRYALPMQWRIQ